MTGGKGFEYIQVIYDAEEHGKMPPTGGMIRTGFDSLARRMDLFHPELHYGPVQAKRADEWIQVSTNILQF